MVGGGVVTGAGLEIGGGEGVVGGVGVGVSEGGAGGRDTVGTTSPESLWALTETKECDVRTTRVKNVRLRAAEVEQKRMVGR